MGLSKDKKPSSKKWYEGYLFAACRKIWRWSPERKQALKDSEVKGEFICAVCKRGFTKDLVAVDHVQPVINPLLGFTGWDNYVDGLFTTASNLQVLCKVCHKAKTQAENKVRRQQRKK